MPHPCSSSEEIRQRGKELYERPIRSKVETDENIGKGVSIDIETGDYEMGEVLVFTEQKWNLRVTQQPRNELVPFWQYPAE